jgi:predicted small lipoprotein YifL
VNVQQPRRGRLACRPGRTRRSAPTILALFAFVAVIACGKKGPPLPPLVKLPAPPADFTAVRRGGDVALQFTVPAANSDGTRPANVERVDVYAFTGPSSIADEQILKHGTKVGSVPVKAPRDPDVTVDSDQPEDETEPLEGEGLDQGASARLHEALTPASLEPIAVDRVKKEPAVESAPRPLLGPPPTPPLRTYVAVGIAKRGRKGPLSKRIGVPLVAPPPPPSMAPIDYNEKAIIVSWTPPVLVREPREDGKATDGEHVLPSHPTGVDAKYEVAYNVYETTPDGEKRLTKSPVTAPRFTDDRVTWGVERCYIVRTVEVLGGVPIESDARPAVCAKPVDTFPPAAPKELHAVAGEGSINLIWEPNEEKDLAGYVVLRGVAPGERLEPLTAKPIPEARYTDQVPAGTRYVYAVQAVDKAGNVGPASNRVEETAR